MRNAAASTVKDRAVALPNLDSIIRGLLYVYIFCLPFKRLLFVERNGFIILVALLVLWCAVNRRHFLTRTPIDLPLIAFIAWVAFTVPFAASPSYSAKEFAKLLQQGLIFYVVAYFFRDRLHRTRLLWMLVGGLSVISLYGIGQFVDLLGVKPQEGEMMLVESVTPGEVWLTTYLVMLIPLGLALALYVPRPSARMVGLAAVGAATLCLLLTFSRAGVLALVCEAAAVAWFVRRRAVLIGMAAAVLAVVLGSAALFQFDVSVRGGWKAARGSSLPLADTGSLSHRYETWTFAMDKFADHWAVGVGYGKDSLKLAYEGRAASGATPVNLGTHNTFIEMASGVGLPGLILFVWLLLRIVVTAIGGLPRAVHPAEKAILLGLGVSVIGLSVRLSLDHMLIGTLALQFWVLVALAMVVYTGSPDRGHVADAA